MSAFHKLACPNCGAMLDVAPVVNSIQCDKCGCSLAVIRSNDRAALRIVSGGEKRPSEEHPEEPPRASKSDVAALLLPTAEEKVRSKRTERTTWIVFLAAALSETAYGIALLIEGRTPLWFLCGAVASVIFWSLYSSAKREFAEAARKVIELQETMFALRSERPGTEDI
jgi:hypothetical protein